MGLLPTLAPLERVDAVGNNTAPPAPRLEPQRKQGVVVAAWFMLNPILFPPPRNDSAFATRAVLGEERWLEERPVSGALAINCIASAAALIAIDSARRHRRRQMTIATIGTMSALLWYWREMVRFYDTRGDHQ
jgi:hypothetical protein